MTAPDHAPLGASASSRFRSSVERVIGTAPAFCSRFTRFGAGRRSAPHPLPAPAARPGPTVLPNVFLVGKAAHLGDPVQISLEVLPLETSIDRRRSSGRRSLGWLICPVEKILVPTDCKAPMPIPSRRATGSTGILQVTRPWRPSLCRAVDRSVAVSLRLSTLASDKTQVTHLADLNSSPWPTVCSMEQQDEPEMLIIEIVLDAKACQGLIAAGFDVFWRPLMLRRPSSLFESEFGRENHFVAPIRDGASNQALVVPIAIDIGCV